MRRWLERYRAWRRERYKLWLAQFDASVEQRERAARAEARREREYGRLTLTEDGFRLQKRGRCKYEVRWDEVVEIQTFKRDLFTTDEICLGFCLVGDERVEAWESMIGFEAFSERVRAVFPSIPGDWLAQVVQPPFATNQRTLWRRAEKSSG